MKPELMQNLSQFIVLIGIILTAIGGYGHFYYGKKLENKRDGIVNNRLDSIPSRINSKSNANTEKVLGAIKDVKQTLDKLPTSEDTIIRKIGYPDRGEFGINILDKHQLLYKEGTYSMKVLVPKNQNVMVKISGTKWGFPAFQALPGWKNFDFESTPDNKVTRKFKTVKYGSADLEFSIREPDEIDIQIYENDSKTPTWNKKIIVSDKNK